jgi:hypothetical protein
MTLCRKVRREITGWTAPERDRVLMYYSRTLWSGPTERGVACLAGMLLLTHTLAGRELVQDPPPLDPIIQGLQERRETIELDGTRVDLRFLLGSHTGIHDRIVETTKDVVARLVAWFGPLPAPQLTIVDAPWHRAPADALPGVVVISSRWLQPPRDAALEWQLAAGLARLPWVPFKACSDEEQAFVDGLTRYTAVRALHETLEARYILHDVRPVFIERYFGGHIPYGVRSLVVSRRPWDRRAPGFRLDEFDASPQGVDPSDRTPRSRSDTTAAALLSLERLIGWPALQQALATLVSRFQRQTPRAPDLVAIVDEQRGGKLPALLVSGLTGAVVVDYAVEALTSEPGSERGTYRTAVRVVRSGTAAPEHNAMDESSASFVALTVRFANGDQVSEWLAEQETDRTFEYDSRSRAVQASVDPDAVVLFDPDRGNNTRSLTPRLPAAGFRHLLNWLVWLQDLALTGSALV